MIWAIEIIKTSLLSFSGMTQSLSSLPKLIMCNLSQGLRGWLPTGADCASRHGQWGPGGLSRGCCQPLSSPCGWLMLPCSKMPRGPYIYNSPSLLVSIFWGPWICLHPTLQGTPSRKCIKKNQQGARVPLVRLPTSQLFIAHNFQQITGCLLVIIHY